MTSLPIEQWRLSLDAMEATLASMVDKINSTPEVGSSNENQVLPDPDRGTALLALLENKFAEWNSRIAAVGELVASVENELEKRTSAVLMWRTAFSDAMELIKHY